MKKLLVVVIIVFMIIGGTIMFRNKDVIKHTFENDENIQGTWIEVDFVRVVDQFDPESKNWKGELLADEFEVNSNGITNYPDTTWSKGFFFDESQSTKSQYFVKVIDGTEYLFYEWKNFDYIYMHKKPYYKVFRRVVE